MQPLSGNQHPDLLTSLMNMSFVLHLPRKMHLCRSSSNVPRLPSFLEMLQNTHVLLTFDKVHNPLRLPRETTPERPKVVQTHGALYILTSKTCTLLWREAHFEVKMLKTLGVRTNFRGSDVVSRGKRKGLCTWSKFKSEQNVKIL